MILRNPHFQPVQFSTTAHFYHDLEVLLVEPADLERVPGHAVVYKVVHDLAEEDEQAECRVELHHRRWALMAVRV